MKHNFKYRILSVIAFILCFLKIEAQVSWTLNNNGGSPSTDYVGWDNSVGYSLKLKTTNDNPIDFYTDFGTNSNLRMTLTGGSSNTTGGLLGIGLSSPQNRLHVDGGTDYHPLAQVLAQV
ncbi:MAG TPA: hypothetical protein VE978_09120 [Chitinophagales bacterium]|nr:hypothetical protein [Chitinophagales bacterium]